MIATTLVVLMFAAAANSLLGVDPNTLNCDPDGHMFLLLPHHTDCSKYYVCVHGNEVERECNAALIFDFELQVCNWAWAANCTLRTTPAESDESVSVEDESDLIDGSDEGSGDGSGEFEWSSNSDKSGDELRTAGVADLLAQMAAANLNPKTTDESSQFHAALNCARAEDAAKQIAYKGDCQRFLRCANGVIETSYCTDGLFFNEKSMQCDFEANVQCGVNHEYELQGEFMVYEK